MDVNKGGQGKRELWVKNSKPWSCSLLLARGEEKEFLDQLTGALGEEIQCTRIRCEGDGYFLLAPLVDSCKGRFRCWKDRREPSSRPSTTGKGEQERQKEAGRANDTP